MDAGAYFMSFTNNFTFPRRHSIHFNPMRKCPLYNHFSLDRLKRRYSVAIMRRRATPRGAARLCFVIPWATSTFGRTVPFACWQTVVHTSVFLSCDSITAAAEIPAAPAKKEVSVNG
jgi:hypothetical protein